MSIPTVDPSRLQRDRRLDFWRGLCLVDMIVIHLLANGLAVSGWLHLTLSEYFRFAAGGFVMISGASIAFIYLPRLRAGGASRADLTLRLWQRAAFVLVVHYASTLTAWAIAPALGNPIGNPRQALLDILLLRTGHDLLPFYVLMLLAAPMMLELLHRRLGWALAIVSGAIFASWWANETGPALPLQEVFVWQLWQPLFVIGMLLGSCIGTLDAMSRVSQRRLVIGCWIAAAALTVLAYADHFITFTPPVAFYKFPMTAGEVARYVALVLAIVLTINLYWSTVSRWWWTRPVELMGRHSLGVFAGHMFVVWPLAAWSERYVLPGATQLLWAGLAVVIMLSVAWVLDRWPTWISAVRARQRALPQRVAIGWLAAACAVMMTLPESPVEFAEQSDLIAIDLDESTPLIDPDGDLLDPADPLDDGLPLPGAHQSPPHSDVA